jgi:hypothetical protein
MNQHQTQRPAAEKRNQDSEGSGDQGGASLAVQQLGIQLQPHEKHEQHHSELAQHVQVAERRLRKQRIHPRAVMHEPQQRWSEHDARDHLTHHLRLIDEPHEQPQQAREKEHDANVDQQNENSAHRGLW